MRWPWLYLEKKNVFTQPPSGEGSGVRIHEPAPPTDEGEAPVLTPQPPLPAGEGEQSLAVPDTVPPPDTLSPFHRSPFPRYEAGLYATFGLAQLLADLPAGSMYPAGLSPGFGAEFTYYFARHWGVGAGAEVAFFSVRLFNAGIGVEESGNPATSYLLKHTSHVKATYLRVPLWLRFRTPLGRHEFQAAAGGMFDLALTGSRRIETVMRTGDSPATETVVTNGSLRFGHGISLAAEAGLRWRLGEHWGIYAGVYGGYGLTGVQPSGNALPGVENIHLLSASVKVKIVIND